MVKQSVLQNTEKKESIIDDVIFHIQSHCNEGHWSISPEEVIEILNIEKEDYYKNLYSFKKHGIGIPIKEFNENNCDILCVVLGKIFNDYTFEDNFFKSGLYFNKNKLHSLKSEFERYVYSILEKHKLDKELLILLSSATLNFDDAFDSYFDDKFEIDILIGRCVHNYTECLNIETSYGSDLFLRKYLRKEINHHKISMNKITIEFRDRYYYEIFGRERNSFQYIKMSIEIKKLYDFFGLKYSSNKKHLKVKYKELLKIYHPDINKEGLEKTKKIILYYKKLLHYMNEVHGHGD